MATKIKHKRSSVSGNVPTAGQIDVAEFAFNTTDGSIFIKNEASDIIDVTANLYKKNTSIALTDTGTDGTITMRADGTTTFEATSTLTSIKQNVSIEDAKELRLKELTSNGANYAGLKAPDSLASSYTFTLPTTNGTLGQLMSTDGAGQLYFSDPDTFGGNRVYVSASKGDDANDGFTKPVLTIKRACQIASSLVYTSGSAVNGQRVNVIVAAGSYTEQNPIIIPDNVTIKGDSLRSVIIRPANANQDMLRVRNGCYFGEFTFRDGLSGGTPTFTFNYCVAFDDPLDVTVDRTLYTYLPSTKPLITQSPYIQNCSIISFLGGNGVLVDGSKVITPNTSATQIEAENPVSGAAPDQGKSMVANAFTMLSFGGTGWRLINDAYAQIVSCFQIFMLNGVYTQSGGYCSITNSATNFGLYALRASGYSPNAFAFDKGYIGTTGTIGSIQTITAFGWTREDGPINEFVIRLYDPSTTADLTSTYKTTLPGYVSESFDAATDVNTTTNIFTITSHGFLNGDTVAYDSNGGTEISPLFNGEVFYIGYLTGNTFKLFYDDSLTREVNILSVGVGTQSFNTQDYEMYVDEVTETHNQFQTLTLDAGSPSGYSFTIGDTIEGTTGAFPNNAFVYSYDSGTRQLVVCINPVTIGLTETRNNFTTSSQITSVAGVAASYFMTTSVVSRTDLYGADFEIQPTIIGGAFTSVATLPGKQIWFHRPSITNSSAHTWEYAGSGTDYNALPQNGGKGNPAYEQVSQGAGKVYTSGTNELGDFKVGNFITAFNRTGNVTFTNKITVDTLDVLKLGVGGVTVESISIDPELGLNESGGPKDSRISTQLAVYSYNQIHLGNVIDKNVSTNAVPGSLVQLNSNGQINSDLIPTSRSFSSFSSAGLNSRLDHSDNIPAGDVLSGDIAVEAFYQQELTIDNPITAEIGTAVIQTTANTATTSITSTINSFTVTHAGTLANSTYVLIEGVTPTAYNGVWLINRAVSGSFTVFTNINPGTATVQGTIYYGGASGRLKGSYTAATSIIVGSVFTNFNTPFVTGASTLIIGTDRTPSDTNTAVTVSIASTASTASLNYFLNVGTYSQYLVLENSATPTFTNGSISKAFRYSNVGYITTSLAHNFTTGNEIKINATTDNFDGTDYVTVISSTEFSYSSSGTDTAASATTTSTATLVGVTGTSTTGSVATASLTGTITVGDYAFGATLPYGAKVTVVNMAVNPRTFTIAWPTSATVTGTSTAALTFVTPVSETGTVRSVLTAADSSSQGEFTELRSGVLTSVNNLSGLTGGSSYVAGIYSRVPLTNQTVATTSISSTATVATITHGTTVINTFVTGSQVVIAGTTASSGPADQYNGTWTVTLGASGSFTITGTFTNTATASVQGTVASGVGECALAAITVSGAGAVTDVDLVFGGANYAVGSTLTTSNAYLGGSGSGFKITTTAIEKRAYVKLFGGQTFIATPGAPDFVEENASLTNTADATTTVVATFDAQSTGAGGGINTVLNRITTLAPHGFGTGDPVLYNPGVDPAVGGLVTGSVYYVKVIDASTIELYTNYGVSTIIVLSTSTGAGHTFTRKTVDIINNTLAIPSHGFNTGDAFRINGSDLPYISSVQITSGNHYFVGSVTTNSFSIHELRSDALDSVSGVTINPLNITATGSGNFTITKNNIKVTATVNTSSTFSDNWNSLTTSTIDASSIVSGIISTSRLASGSASSSTFLRGDSTWSPVVQSAALAASSALTLTGTGVGPYTGALTFDVVKADKTGGSGGYSTTGVASFNTTQFSVGTGDSLAAGQVLVKSGVIDAGTLDTYDSSYFLNPSNLTSAVPVNKGGTALVTYTIGDMLYASGSTTLNTLAISVADTIMTSTGSAPQWSPALTIAKNVSTTAADITTSSTSASTVFNTNSTTLNLGGAANNVNIGSSTASQSLSSTVKSYTTAGSPSTTVTVNVGLTAAISTVARATNTATITTSANHGLTTGDVVTVACTSDTAFNAVAVSTTVTGLTTFTYTNTGSDTGSTGGTGSVYIGATGIALGTSASNSDTSLIFASTTGVRAGMLVQSAASVPAGTTVVGVNATRVYLSAALTGTIASGVAIIFTDTNTSLGISTGNQVTIASSTITNLDGTWPVTSAGATSTTFNIKVTTAATATNDTRAGTIVRINNLMLKNRTVTLGSSEASASPVTATLKGENAVGTNVAGAALTIRPGLSTGNATGAVINFQTGTTGTTGDTTQSAITRMAVTQSSADTTLDLTTAMTTANVFNTSATTVNAFGAATAITMGASGANTFTLNHGTLVGSQTTQNVFNSTATTVNAFGAATTIGIGAATGTLTVNNALTVFNSSKAIQLPVGDSAARPSPVTGQIRYNNELGTFEGYAASAWGSLGGVKSVDGLTYIIPETSPGASNDELEFYAAIDASTTSKVGGWNQTRLLVSNTTEATVYTDGALIVSGGVGIAKKLFVNGITTFNSNVNINGVNPSIASTDTGTASIFNANITTINFGQAADISMSAVGKTVTVNGSISINGNTTLGDASGDSVTYTASTGTVTTTHAFTNNDAGTNTVVYPIKFAHTLSSGTAAVGIGSGFQFTAPNASGSVITGGSIEAVSTNVTAASEAYDVVVRAYTAGSSGTVLKANGTSLEVGASNTNTTIRSNGTGTLTVTTGTTGASSAGAIVTVTGGAGGSTTGAGGEGVFKGGDGTTSSAGGVATLKGGAAVGTNITGANTVIEAGNGTGSGGSGSIILRTASAGSSGASADTMTDRLTISNTGNISFAGAVTIGGDLTVNGTVTTINSSTVTIDDKNIELASVAAVTGLTVTLTNGSATVTFIGTSTTTGLLAGQTLTITSVQTGSPAFGGAATIVSVDSLTQVTMFDPTTGTSGNVTISSSGSSDATADGGGVTVKGATDKTWSYVNSNTAWTSNQNIDAATGKTYKINGTDVLSASAVLPNAATASIGATGSAATVNIGSTSNNNILNIYANGTTGTATLGTNVTNGTVNVFAGVTNIINYSEAATTITLGNTATAAQSVSMFTASTGSSTYNFATGATLNGNTKAINIGTAGVSGSTSNISINSTVSGALGTTTIGGATLTVSTPTAINLGTSTAALTTVTVGGAITGNILKIAGTAAGIANITTDVTSGTFNIAQSVTGTVAIGSSGTVQLGTSASVVTIAQVGGAVDGNTLKIAGTAAGTTSGITTDVTSGTFNIGQSVTGTVKIGASGTVQLGTSASVTTVAQVGGAVDGNTLKIAGTAAGTTSGITTDVTTGTFNIAQSVTGIVKIGSSGTVQLGTSASVVTIAQVGGAVTGNTLKIAGTAGGTASITTDVISGTFDIAQSVDAGTVRISSSGTVRIGTSTLLATALVVGGVNPAGNILKIASEAAGTATISTDVTSGTFNIAQSVTGIVKIGSSGTVQLGTSASAVTTALVGGAITGNILKIAGTTTGTINLTTDVTTGSVNVFTGLTTATMTIGSANGGRVAIAFNQASTSTTTGAVTIAGGLGVAGAVNAQTKSFIISHPTKPGKLLKHGSLEGPEFGVYVRGKVTGKIIELPDYWLGLVNEDTITVDLTPIGKHQKLYVEKIEGNRVYINNEGLFSGSVSCFYTVWGERKDVGSLEIELDE